MICYIHGPFKAGLTIYTPNVGAAELLDLNGKFTMGKSKPSLVKFRS